jgi:hypothetical protein
MVIASNKDIGLTCCNGTHIDFGIVLFCFLNVTSVVCETASTATDSTFKQEAQKAGCISYNKQIFSFMQCANANAVNVLTLIHNKTYKTEQIWDYTRKSETLEA